MVYGRAAKGNFALLTQCLKARIPLPFGAIANRRAFVAAENVASFITYCLASRVRGIHLVADDEQVSTPDFVRRMGTAMKRKAVLPRVPAPLIHAAAKLVRRGPLAQTLLNSLEADLTATYATGWRPAVTMNEGLQLALSQYDRE
jgi:UDP-glucose 4-epimerase